MEHIRFVIDPTASDAPPVGETLRAMRKRQGVTQIEISLSTGLGQRAISEIETGRVEPRMGTVLRILAALGGRVVFEIRDDDV